MDPVAELVIKILSRWVYSPKINRVERSEQNGTQTKYKLLSSSSAKLTELSVSS